MWAVPLANQVTPLKDLKHKTSRFQMLDYNCFCLFLADLQRSRCLSLQRKNWKILNSTKLMRYRGFGQRSVFGKRRMQMA
jgi:hypothetical protein